jgi:hypothetical protein
MLLSKQPVLKICLEKNKIISHKTIIILTDLSTFCKAKNKESKIKIQEAGQ